MIVFNKELDFDLQNPEVIRTWIGEAIDIEGFKVGELNYIFVSDENLLEKNIKFLNHNTLTDIISFDYTMGKLVSGDIFISIDRVLDNSKTFKTTFENELHRVMIHGVLHYCGFKDKSEEDKKIMREREDFHLNRLKL
ncbi:MAG: rRNA maturation RNase YbeY [Flavobacteriaceae bacterium]|nr:rRNA maturation RNase YbeY [Flavobacteriaceae bacterium]